MEKLLTEEELKAIAARLEQTTPGPWTSIASMRQSHEEEDHDHIDGPNGEPIAIVELGEYDGDAWFIQHARTDVPRLLNDVRVLAAANSELAKTNADLQSGFTELIRQVETAESRIAILVATANKTVDIHLSLVSAQPVVQILCDGSWGRPHAKYFKPGSGFICLKPYQLEDQRLYVFDIGEGVTCPECIDAYKKLKGNI